MLLQFRVRQLVGAPDPASVSLLESLAVNRTPWPILSTDIAPSLRLKNAKVRDLGSR